MKRLRIGLAMLTAGMALPPAGANDAYVLYRQQVMQAVGGHAGAIGVIVKAKLPDIDAIALHADAVADLSSTVPLAFAAELHEGATDALPKIWQDMDDFLSHNEKMREASLLLADAARGGDADALRGSIRTFTKSCGACHRNYRKPKEESYKQRR